MPIMRSPRIIACLGLLALGLTATEARAQTPPASNDGTPAQPGPGPAAQPGYPPNAYPPPPSGYPPQAGYPPPSGYPPSSGYPPGQGYPPQPGYPPAQPGYPPPPRGYYAGSYGPPPATPPGWHSHDGAYLRLQLGFGYTSMSTGSSTSDLKVSGGGAGFGIAIGGAVSKNVIIYGTIVDSLASNPTVERDGISQTANGASAGVVGLGGGLAYYLDNNVFFAGSLLASRLVINDTNGNQIGKSDWGFTFEGLFGKEWWVSDDWGIGASLQVMLGRMKDQDTFATASPPTWSVAAFNLLFSATYN